MGSYKIIGRHPFSNRQLKKRVYTSTVDYIKYKDDLTKRYKTYLNVEHYELINDKWQLILKTNYNGGCNWLAGYPY
jgi:hypothetical protein